MLRKSEAAGYCAIILIFVALLYWYAAEISSHYEEEELRESWPETEVDRQTLDWIEDYWQIETFPQNDVEESFRFWQLRSFKDSYILEVRLTSNVSWAASVTVVSTENLSDDGVPWLRSYDGAMSEIEIEAFWGVLDAIAFWTSPPGKLGWVCTDGETMIVETNIGDKYRLWANSCEASQEMLQIASFASRVAERVSHSNVKSF